MVNKNTSNQHKHSALAYALLIAGCSSSMTQPSGCPVPPSDLMTPPVALMRIDGDPQRAPVAIRHNAEALLSDRDRLIRWQKWYEKPLD